MVIKYSNRATLENCSNYSLTLLVSDSKNQKNKKME
uniref:Uncharacterized protein n=1 Tax=Rhizophora mucronata TaxID=61149 RepID=A0A2P2MX09_RHIMU